MCGMKKPFVLTLAVLFISFLHAEGSLSVLVVGGGPAGLATAIEAAESGAQVTLIEKRTSYTRNRLLFLFESSLTLLDRWKVNIPQMKIADLGDAGKFGSVSINHLEEGLAARAHELGIQKIHGEFKRLEKNRAVIATPGRETHLSYDILVGADGAHSLVREELGIGCEHLGKAVGMWAFMVFDTPVDSADITPTIEKNDFFIRKISLPTISIIFAQSSCTEQISRKEFETLVSDCGWHDEAELIAKSKAKISDSLEIPLQQAHSFSCKKKSTILVGDAAATASFFQGMGANTALKTAAIAGTFFNKVQQHDKDSYRLFNQQMKDATDELIEDSNYLFKQP
jgi:2-polyprenyl-6-methoxyphenol hydroxylase-like FAD-dependent oxidoreductase